MFIDGGVLVCCMFLLLVCGGSSSCRTLGTHMGASKQFFLVNVKQS